MELSWCRSVQAEMVGSPRPAEVDELTPEIVSNANVIYECPELV